MYNSVTLIGRLGATPEFKKTPNGDNVCIFSVATNEKWKNANGNEQGRTTWLKIVTWNRLAENCNEFLETGRLVFIEGELVNNNWEDSSGIKRYEIEVRAKRVLFLDSSNQDARKGK